MSDYEFSLPFPPSVNSIRACVRNRLITSKKGREYFETVKQIMDGLNLSNEMIDKPITVRLVMHPPTLRRYDVSNFLKAYEDGLVKCGFIKDDDLIEYGYIKKGEKTKPGRIDISIIINN